METTATATQTQTLRYCGPEDVPESPGYTLVTRDADGSIYCEDIIDDERARQLYDAGVPMDNDTDPAPSRYRLLATAVTVDGYGDREVIVQPQTYDIDEHGQPEYLTVQDKIVARAPLPPTDETVDVDDVCDAALAGLGYRRAREWEVADFGAVAVVEAL